MSHVHTLSEYQKDHVYMDRSVHEAEIKKLHKLLNSMGVKYQSMGKRYILEKKVTEKQSEQIRQLIQIIKKLENNQKPVVDNNIDKKREETIKSLWMKEFNITEKEEKDYIKLKTGDTNEFLSKYLG